MGNTFIFSNIMRLQLQIKDNGAPKLGAQLSKDYLEEGVNVILKRKFNIWRRVLTEEQDALGGMVAYLNQVNTFGRHIVGFPLYSLLGNNHTALDVEYMQHLSIHTTYGDAAAVGGQPHTRGPHPLCPTLRR